MSSVHVLPVFYVVLLFQIPAQFPQIPFIGNFRVQRGMLRFPQILDKIKNCYLHNAMHL